MKDEIDKESAVSFGDILKTSYGNEWYISVYTTSYNAFIASLIHQLEVARESGCDWTVCFYPLQFQQYLDPVLSQVSQQNPIVLDDKVVFLEKPLKNTSQ